MHIQSVRAKMNGEIGKIDTKLPFPRYCHDVLHLIHGAISDVKKYMRSYTFSDRSEEIHYYKDLMPPLISERLYYAAVYEMEIEKGRLRASLFRLYLEAESAQIDRFFEKNRWLYDYHARGETLSDEALYTKEAVINEELDDSCCTTYSYKLSQILANERIRQHIDQEFFKLDHPESETSPSAAKTAKRKERRWIGSKSFAAELIVGLALEELIWVGDRPCTLTEVKEAVEEFLDIDLKDFKNLDYANRGRKKDMTPLLTGMRDKYMQRADRLNK